MRASSSPGRAPAYGALANPSRTGGWRTFALFWALGSALLAGYAHVTPFNARTHDIGSQLHYIQLVKEHRRIPGSADCWECHQPPAYYALAAAILAAGGWEVPKEHAAPQDAGPGARALQVLGVALSAGTLACWLLIIRLTLVSRYERAVASALAAFWPTLAIDGCTVNSDPLVCLLASASLWQLVSWRRTGRATSLVAAGALAGMALNAKASGVPMAAVVVAAILAAVARAPHGAPRWPRGAAPALAVLGALGASSALVVARFKGGVVHPAWASMGGNLHVDNTWRDFVELHLGTFAADPWVHFDASPARDEFWNYVIRSSLFAESSSTDPATIGPAYALVAATVALAAFVAAGLVVCLVRGARRQDGGHRELAMAFVALFGFLMALRLRFPYSVHNDFRFILPAVAPCAVMFALAAGAFRRRTLRRWPHLAALPGWLVAAFCVISARLLLFWS